jgi:predicted amidohydrolase YtcJ
MAMRLAPDLVAHNGKVITVDASFRIADALAIKDGRFVAIGGGPALLDAADAQTIIIDLKGRTVTPGLIDGHAHLDREGLRDVYPSLAGARSIDDILQRIESLVRAAEPGAWIVTMPIGEPPSYWNIPDSLAEKRWPTRRDLDKVSPDNPVFIRPVWGFWRHDFSPLVSIANTKALRIAGIDRTTVAPTPSIEIEKDSSGEPTGIFSERTLQPIVELTLMRCIGGFSHADRAEGLRKSMRAYHATGTTSVYEGHGVAPEVLRAYQELHAADELTMRADLVFSPSWGLVRDTPIPALLKSWAGWIAGRGLGDDTLRMAGMFAEVTANADDNALRAGAHPYTGWAGFHYDQQLPPDRLIEAMVACARNDIRIVTLTMEMLPHIEAANRIEPIRDKRWVLSHIGIMNDEQISRVRDLGLVTSTNSNRYIYRSGSSFVKQVGDARAHEILPMAKLRDAGIKVSLATDNVPTSLFHPVWQVVARRDRDTGSVIAPEQGVSRADALRNATIDGAYLSMSESDKGSIEIGKLGDFAVLSADPLTCAEDDLKDVSADIAVVGGRVVYERSS